MNCSYCQVQSSIGHSDYVKRDQALKNLIQPLAGEYGMHNNQPQGTHMLCDACLMVPGRQLLTAGPVDVKLPNRDVCACAPIDSRSEQV